MTVRFLVFCLCIGLARPALGSPELRLELEGVSPQQILARPGLTQPLLLANDEIFLQCAAGSAVWLRDSTRIALTLPSEQLILRLDGRDLEWSAGEHEFETALHLRSERVTLVAKAGTLYVDGQDGVLLAGRAPQRNAARSVQQGWLLSSVIGAAVALLFLQWRIARHRRAPATALGRHPVGGG